MNMKEYLNTPSEPLRKETLHLTKRVSAHTAAFNVNGDCMQGKQIYDGDTILVDLDRKPRAGDPCLCIIRGKPMIKVFHSTLGKGIYDVSTCYDWNGRPYKINPDGTLAMNQGFFASEIGGVVIGSFDKAGEPRWMKDYDSFPFELPEISLNEKSNVRFVS